MNVPDQVLRLVETFDRNIHAYKGKKYNETQVRREFIDPFFIALGWDINNTQGLAEAYKDVIHEDSIRIGSALKAPDYCFRIGGTRKFFVEAKNPSINIKDDPHTAFQLRRYAWSAKLPLSILTDFEEFAVYDCCVKPLKTDRASTARTIYINYKEYPDRWGQIASIFSKDAIQKGSFDKYALSAKRKKGTAEVDTAFLAEIENWRDLLARNIALRNESLTNRQLNYAVQRTIDRIIFLRIAEDRGIEQYGQLQALLNGQKTYPRLFTLFKHADDRYNSGLFHFTPEPGRTDCDEISETLIIDDKPLKDIVRSLYYPDSPYAFSVLPAEILGQIYEQFLGKVITLTKAHHAKIEDKPEVKKAGGVYYTPSYIVDYIVKNTVGKLLENKTPTSASKLKILDPACGSGSFLIGAFQYLLDWHLKYYTQNNPEKYTKAKEPRLYQTDRGELRLTVAERKRILINNIFGVDIDSQAVEVTKLSLLLKVLEGQKRLVLFHKERALPDLSNNIKCGNSLIGPDFYQNQQLTFFDEEEQYKINVFDWKTEFPQILNRKNPGFDAVIGNPPYVQVLHSQNQIQLDYFSNNYVSTSSFKKNLFPVFIERSLQLMKPNRSRFSMIIPDRFFFTPSYIPCRKHILENVTLENIREILAGAFKEATVGNAVFFISSPRKLSYKIDIEQWHGGEVKFINRLPVKDVTSDPEAVINLLMTQYATRILKKCKNSSLPLKNLASAHVGVMIKDNKSLFTKSRISKSQKKIVKGRQLKRYSLANTFFFDPHKAKIFGGTKNPKKHETSPKIILRKTGDRLIAYLDTDQIYAEQSVYLLLPDSTTNPYFILGVLNSKLLLYLFKNCFITNPVAYPYIQHYDLEKLPIYKTNLSDSEDKSRHDKMVSLVETMLDLNKKLPKAKTAHEKTILQRQITATDNRIDKLVYELYDLTEEEIKIIEESTK